MTQVATPSGEPAAGHTRIIDRVRESTTSQISRQKDRATEGLGSVAQAVKQSSRQLREQHHDTIAQYIDQAADQLEHLSTRLKEKNVDEFVADAQRFARQRPALFIGSAFAVGLLSARFFKSSSQHDRDGHESEVARPVRTSSYTGGEMR